MRYSVHWRNANRRVGHLDTWWVVNEATVVALWTSYTPPPELQKSHCRLRVAARVPKEKTAVLDRWRVTFADRHRPTGQSPEWLNSTRENSFLQSSGQSKSQVKNHTSLSVISYFAHLQLRIYFPFKMKDYLLPRPRLYCSVNHRSWVHSSLGPFFLFLTMYHFIRGHHPFFTGFSDLSFTDQIRLLQGSWSEISTLNLVYINFQTQRQVWSQTLFFS